MAKNFLYCEETDTKIYANDVVTIFDYPNANWIVKNGWYKFGTAQKHGWYFISIADKIILPIDQVDLTKVKKYNNHATDIGASIKDVDTEVKIDYMVIPGTNIRLYDGDIVKISNRPRVKWIVHQGWFIYQGVQNFNWYFVSIKDGEILPASAVDLTRCTLVTSKTQGSEEYDGKVVNYTRPFTEADAEVLNRTFITLDTIDQRDNLDFNKLVNGRLVRVNDVGGAPAYYAWNSETFEWEKVEDSGGSGIPEVVGTYENPIILSELDLGLYRVSGYYKIIQADEAPIHTLIDNIAFVNEDEVTTIKVITDNDIKDYIVEDSEITLVDEYATKSYVTDRFDILEQEISEIISELPNLVTNIIEDIMKPIPDEFIQGLFT